MEQAKNTKLIEQSSTLFLKVSLIAIAGIVLLFAAIILPSMIEGWNGELRSIDHYKYPFVFGIAATIIPFLYALFHGWKILTNIDRGTAFSVRSVKSLRFIKFCAVIIAVIYALLLPVVYEIAQIDDAPGLILIYTAIFVGGPLIVSVAAAVLERLLFEALRMKHENELTV